MTPTVLTPSERVLRAYDVHVHEPLAEAAGRVGALRGHEVRQRHLAARWLHRLLYPGTRNYVLYRVAVTMHRHGVPRGLSNRVDRAAMTCTTPRWDAMQRKVTRQRIAAMWAANEKVLRPHRRMVPEPDPYAYLRPEYRPKAAA